jgi:hypothetical protein
VEEALAFCADMVHLLVMLLEVLACAELLCVCVSGGLEANYGARVPHLTARGTCVVLLLKMAPPFVVVVKVYLAFRAVNVVTTLSEVRLEAVLGIEDLHHSD